VSTGDQKQDQQAQNNEEQTVHPVDEESTEVVAETDSGLPDQENDESGQPNDPVAVAEALEQAKDQVLRIKADMQNLRRRADRDIENAHKYALENFVAELLPVIDNLERGIEILDENLDHTDEAQKASSEGIELTLKSFQDVLTRNKVEPVDPASEKFNPEFHQAMAMIADPEVPANTVIEVFQKGYLLNGRLVRPAMVVVSSGAENNDAQG
jgi:molecular chaperone GrpE